ncbi:MAG: HEAT repeat domain-containing protein [Planctomycetaceae bacterium]|nr:HEAT repeat domain-containing protein [Planctomycetaceae bacterium]
MKYRFTTLTVILALLLTGGTLSAQNSDLSTLIPDMSSQDMKVRADAQQTWQKECMKAGAPGNTAAQSDVCKQMAEQLGKDLPPVTKVWLLHQIGWVGNAEIVPAVAALLNDNVYVVRDEAVRALAKIPAPEALDALKNALAKETDAAKKKVLEDAIASRNVSLAVGVETKAPQSLPYVSEDEFAAWMKNYATMSNDDKCVTLAALTVRGDKKYHDVVRQSLASDNNDVKRHAILALAKLGTTEDLPDLLKMLSSPDQELTALVMTRIVADGFDDALLKQLNAEKDSAKYLALANILANRNVNVVGPLLKTAAAKDVADRVQYLRIAEPLAKKEDVSKMVGILLMITDSGQKDEAEKIITRICKGDSSPVMSNASPESAPQLFSLLGRIGDEKALEGLRKAMKSPTANIKNAAYRGICNWPNAKVANELLEYAGDKSLPENIRIATLRAFVRVISLPNEQIGVKISTEEKLNQLKKAMEIATRNEEKQLIIDRASAVRSIDSLKFIMQYIDTPELAQNVCRSVEELAHQDFLRRADKQAFADAMEKVLKVSDDNNLKERIRRYQQQL